MTEFLSTKEACEFLKVSKVTLDRWCAEGIIPFYRPSGKRLFNVDELKSWVEKYKVGGHDE